MKNQQLIAALKLTLQWIGGILFTMSGISILFTYPMTSLGFLIIGFTCIPPLRELMESKWLKTQLTSAQRYIMVLIGYSIATTSGLAIQGQNLNKLQEIKESKTVTIRDTVMVIKHDTIIKTMKETVTIIEKVPKIYESTDYGAYQPSSYGSSSRSSTRSGYIRGPRGGCYYINSNGNKVYVDRSLCD